METVKRASPGSSSSQATDDVMAVDQEKSAMDFDDSNSKLQAPDSNIRLDRYGLALQPQPSKWADDPLNWPPWLKWAVLLQVGFMAFLGPFNSATPNASLVLLAKAYHREVETVAYSTTTAIIVGGVSPFILTPLTNVYGRRPITLFAQICAILGQIGAAKSTNFSALLGARAVCGIGMGGLMSVGTTCLNDMFYLHERGEKTGVYTIFVANGAHMAVITGGFIAVAGGVAWDFWYGAIVTSASFILAIFLFPETLFSRDPEFLQGRTRERSYWEMLFNLKGNLIPQRKIRVGDFFTFLYMLKYPSVAFCFWFYIWVWGFINILPAISMSSIYTSHYHFNAGIVGVCTGVSLLIGTLIGEIFTGKLTDIIMSRAAKRYGGERKPEQRLYLTPVAIVFMVAGMITFGWCIQERTSYFPPLVGLAIGCLGLQIATTCMYAYVSDCYRPQTPESAILLNLSRGLTFVVGFFNVKTWEAIGYGWTWTMFAILLFVFWLPILALMLFGERWRKKLGKPSFHQWL